LSTGVEAGCLTSAITVEANLLAIIADWRGCGEHPQPPADIAAFERITGLNYPGP